MNTKRCLIGLSLKRQYNLYNAAFKSAQHVTKSKTIFLNTIDKYACCLNCKIFCVCVCWQSQFFFLFEKLFGRDMQTYQLYLCSNFVGSTFLPSIIYWWPVVETEDSLGGRHCEEERLSWRMGKTQSLATWRAGLLGKGNFCHIH